MLRFSPLVIVIIAVCFLAGCAGGTSQSPTSAQTPVQNTPVQNDPSPAPSNSQTFANLDQNPGWIGFAELPSSYSICQTCSPDGPQVTWSLKQAETSPSFSGNSAEFSIGGQTPYADVLWVNHLIGDLSTEGLPDTDHTLVPTFHNFVYDVYFYSGDPESAQALEFDINQFFDNTGFIWGHQCRVAGGHEWDTWDNVNSHWIPTGVPCNPVANSWNHVTIQVQRTSDGNLLFQSITFNGVTNALNITRPPGSAPGWHGITVNYQMDGNSAQQPYSVWLNQFSFSYW